MARTRGSVRAREGCRCRSICKKRVGEGGQDRMALPAWPGAAFKMIEAELAFQFLILLFDGPPLMCGAHQGAKRGCRRQVAEKVSVRVDWVLSPPTGR